MVDSSLTQSSAEADRASTQAPDFPHTIADHRSESVQFASPAQMVSTLGAADESLRVLEESFPAVTFHARGDLLSFSGDATQVGSAHALLIQMRSLVARGTRLTAEVVRQMVSMLASQVDPSQVLGHSVLTTRGRNIRPKTLNQKLYLDSIESNTVIFGIGPAGTGKTYLAMAMAVQALQNKEVSRIILTRPAVEAGERLGFLPGTLTEKIDPYLRPLYDALHDMLDPESIPRLMASGVIEVAPLAYMRGRTLNDAFIILDEAQNTTGEQMKMFLTRLGFGSKMVITGDVTQVDLPRGVRSGLRVVEEILGNVDGVNFSHLHSADVVRHHLVSEIVSAYERAESSQAKSTPAEQSRFFSHMDASTPTTQASRGTDEH